MRLGIVNWLMQFSKMSTRLVHVAEHNFFYNGEKSSKPVSKTSLNLQIQFIQPVHLVDLGFARFD